MKREAFSESMKKVLAFSRPPETDVQSQALENYLGALYMSVIMWTPEDFDTVCQELVKTVKTTTRPDPKAFHEIRRNLQDSKRSKSSKLSGCTTCAGTLYVQKDYIFKPTDEEVTSSVPCPKCQTEKHDSYVVDERLVPRVDSKEGGKGSGL